MQFRVVESPAAASSGNEVLLVKDGWNDWYTWHTLFQAYLVRANQERVVIGPVKIAQRGMTPQNAHTILPPIFTTLPEDFFSIGQVENYYETLNSFGAPYRTWFLGALRDGAQTLSILETNNDEEVLKRSLLRDIDMGRVRNRFNRLAHGDTALSDYAFKYTLPIDERAGSPPPALTFKVKPGSSPPSNVHVLIGRNGVGKTRCFDFLARSFLKISGPKSESTGVLEPIEMSLFDSAIGFAGLVTVSFSPFDKYGPLVESKAKLDVRYDYVGLLKNAAPSATVEGVTAAPSTVAPAVKSPVELADDFTKAVRVCREGARRARWARALKMLESDPLFEQIGVSRFAVDGELDDGQVRQTFDRLSSGHSVVLLTITKLVELVEEGSLVLVDEPEGHLHPPLLSAFVRALSDLLVDRNGVAIVATHSPVVLQEVPKTCCWILNRSGHEARADRPEIETFGENVGVLTREVFGLEVVQTGFHRMISAAAKGRTYDEVVAYFNNRLGAEGRALARALTLIATAGDDAPDEAL